MSTWIRKDRVDYRSTVVALILLLVLLLFSALAGLLLSLSALALLTAFRFGHGSSSFVSSGVVMRRGSMWVVATGVPSEDPDVRC